MMLFPFILIGWFGHIIICYYLIRPIRNTVVRTILTFIPCILLSYVSCQNLPQHDAFSIIIISLSWMTSIRLIDLTVFSVDKLLRFRDFLFKTLWILFPLLPLKSKRNEWSIKFYLILIVIKLLLNHWIYRWSMNCETRVSYARILMFYVSMMTISYVLDAQKVLVRILTRDKYTLESFTNSPLLSTSLREFWGRRYNRLIGTVLKESVFEPIRLQFSSLTIASLTTFIVSGFLHVHIALVVFDERLYLFPTFMFFVLHGIVCCLEAKMNIQLPEHVGWLLTQTFLLLTSPVILGPFVKKGSPFLVRHPPPLVEVEWIPRLPVPNFCPQ